MKVNELIINGKTYQFKVGLKILHWIGEDLKKEDLSDIIAYFSEIEIKEKINLKHIPKLAYLVRAAVIAGSDKDLGDLQEWTLSNFISAVKVYGQFVLSLPGNGESDKEILGNLEASQAEA